MPVIKPTVSIVIPTYNIEGHIAQTLDSILAQSFNDFEIVVVDDGSSDGTRRIVGNYADRVRLIEQANGGVCRARNVGFRAALGEFICFVDHDDFWFQDKLALQLAEFERDPTLGVVYSNFTRWTRSESGDYPAPSTLRTDAQGIDPALSGWIYHQLLIDCWILTSTALIRRTVLDDCGLFDEALPYSEDWDLWLRISRKYRCSKLNQSTTLYRQLPSQGSRQFRSIDFRTRLLTQAVARWGLKSPDGSALPEQVFRKQLAMYHIAYAGACLRASERTLAVRSFWQAWKARPVALKPFAYMVAGVLGWQPKW